MYRAHRDRYLAKIDAKWHVTSHAAGDPQQLKRVWWRLDVEWIWYDLREA